MNELDLAKKAGFTNVCEINMDALVAMTEVRDMCASGRCKIYGKRWACPPACGTLEECAARMKKYSCGILVQTTAKMQDDFDVETMLGTEVTHKEHFVKLAAEMRELHPECLPLAAGTCTLCKKCTYPDEPCRRPSEMLSSMEAYGLLVSDVCTRSGAKYNYGPQTMTYTSCILY